MPATPARPGRHQGLKAEAQAAAADEYLRRCAELDALAPLLHQLDQFMPGLRAAGLDLSAADLGLYQERIGTRNMRVLRVMTGGLFTNIKRICGWLEALRALGFTELSRSDSVCPTALMRRGNLLLRVDVLRAPPAAAPAPSPSHSVRQSIAEAQDYIPDMEHAA